MSRFRRIGYAVVGLGHIAQHAVLPGFRHARKSRLVALVSSDHSKAARLARKFGAKHAYGYDDYDACLAEPEVEAVFVASANGAHAEQTIRAANAGKHVLCEKPMAKTVDECRAMIEAARRSRVRLMIAYRKYFEPGTVTLRKMIAAGRLGRLRMMHSSFTFRLEAAKAWHFSHAASGGGSLVDVGVYPVNTCRWLAGEMPVEVAGHAWALDPERFREVDENVVFQMRFSSGLVVQASSSFAAAKSSFLHVHGEKGWATLVPAYSYTEARRLLGESGTREFDRHFRKIDEFALELDALAECVFEGREPEPNGLEGARDVAIMEAIYRSAREQQPIAMSDVEV
ncbi:MAG TPA: Gfo/Idh/MocA family oxidoreductase [Terriglobia bacterium]|nr:Gfo/Idh/MocA family oxidoreductase [Terriglobia bacterium]